MVEKKQVICPRCKKMLGIAEGNVELKCTRKQCKAVVYFEHDKNKATVIREEKGLYDENGVLASRKTSSGVTFR